MRKKRSDTTTDQLIEMLTKSRHWISGEAFDSNDVAKHCVISQARGSQVVSKMMSIGMVRRTWRKGAPVYHRSDVGTLIKVPWSTVDNGVRLGVHRGEL